MSTRPRIVPKAVTRYYVNGKGYANRYWAARHIAKNELRDLVSPLIVKPAYDSDEEEGWTWRVAWRRAYAQFFDCQSEYNRKRLYDRWLDQRTRAIIAEQFDSPTDDTSTLESGSGNPDSPLPRN